MRKHTLITTCTLLCLPVAAGADPGQPPAPPRAIFAQAAPAAPAAATADRPWLALLEPLVTETLQRNPEIQAARREREAAGHRVAPAGAFDDPMLEAGFINVPLPSLSFGKEDMTMKMIGLGQRLPFWGKRGLRQDVAARDAEAVGYGYEETVNRVLRELFVSWYDLALAAQSEQLIERNRGVLAQLVKRDIRNRSGKNIGEFMQLVEPEDLLRYGLIPELVGRLPVVGVLESLDEASLVSILTDPKNAITKQFRKLFEMEGVELEFRPDALNAIARKALKRKTGARGLRTIVESVLLDTMYDLPSLENVSKVVVDESVVEHRSEPYLIYHTPPAPAKIAAAE